jgi:HAD superfamily hydrolase (TIGR01544 family)
MISVNQNMCPEENFHITNSKEWEVKLAHFKKAGSSRLHIITDFEGTLTYETYHGYKRPSLISILRDGNYLSPDYSKKAHELYNFYSKFEHEIELPLSERKQKLQEWWEKHYDLLIQSGLKKDHVRVAVKSSKVKLRAGVPEILKLLQQHGVPVLIMSASGLGKETIMLCLQNENIELKNIEIISNEIIWDEKGNARSYRKPLIHSLNKDESAVQHPSLANALKSRRNAILMGNQLGDLDMSKGIKHDLLLKIGFYNKKEKGKDYDDFSRHFDALILSDGDAWKIHEILQQIVSSQY